MIAVDAIAITVKNKGDKGGFCSYWQSLHVFWGIICLHDIHFVFPILRRLFWGPNGLNELPEMRFEFPLILIGPKRTKWITENAFWISFNSDWPQTD